MVKLWYHTSISKVDFSALSEAGTGSCPAYEKLFMLAVLISHSVAAIKAFNF